MGCVACRMLRLHPYGVEFVFMHIYGGCVYWNVVVCMHCQAGQMSLVVLLLFVWTWADLLCCCCGDCWVGSILLSWMEALLGCALQFCCHVVYVLAGGCWRLLPPLPAVGEICPSFPPSSACWGYISLLLFCLQSIVIYQCNRSNTSRLTVHMLARHVSLCERVSRLSSLYCNPLRDWTPCLQPENNPQWQDSSSLQCVTEAPIANEYY